MISDPVPAPEVSGVGVPYSTGALAATTGLLAEIIRNTALPPPPRVSPKEPAPKPQKPLTVSSGVQSAKLLRQIVPVYPQLAKQARISGTVRLVGIIGKDGTIQNLQLVSGPPLLVQAALDAVRQWVYRPTLLNNEPVEVIAPIDVVFTLNR